MPMGCYGIGVSRIVAAAIEQNYDERGIIWPANLAPFDVVITPIGYQKSEQVKNASDQLYQQLQDLGIDVLLDDRKERPGIMFADADLIGVPHRVVVGDKSLAEQQLEYKLRGAESTESIKVSEAIEFLASKVTEMRLSNTQK
jgi:prolyl-tRNA synthetase